MTFGEEETLNNIKRDTMAKVQSNTALIYSVKLEDIERMVIKKNLDPVIFF